MSLKNVTKELVRKILWTDRPPVLVASMGRSGSTLVHSAIANGMARARFGTSKFRTESLVRDDVWELAGARLKKGRVYKTHALPHGLDASQNLLVVFVFGSASNAVRSVFQCEKVYGKDWIEEHFNHLSATGGIDQLARRDVLRFGEQIQFWLSVKNVPVLSLKYEDLWTSGAETILSRLVGFPVCFPERRQRESSSLDLGDKENELLATYTDLDLKISELPTISANDLARDLIGADYYTDFLNEAKSN